LIAILVFFAVFFIFNPDYLIRMGIILRDILMVSAAILFTGLCIYWVGKSGPYTGGYQESEASPKADQSNQDDLYEAMVRIPKGHLGGTISQRVTVRASDPIRAKAMLEAQYGVGSVRMGPMKGSL
jgi:hypothetical protein